MKQKGISQEELATFLHVSRQTISKWEADLSLPNMEMILQLSEYYEIPVTRLLGIEEDQKVTNESVERLYEQTSVVLENIRKENKKRQTRDVILVSSNLIMFFQYSYDSPHHYYTQYIKVCYQFQITNLILQIT